MNDFEITAFLCHSSEDKEQVRNLYHRLVGDGFSCWFDAENLIPGQDWDREIRKALRRCRYVLACLSEGSVSKAGYVQKELRRALDLVDEQPDGSIFLIPLRLEACEVPDRLQRLHWVDLYEPNGYQRLVHALRSGLAGNPGDHTASPHLKRQPLPRRPRTHPVELIQVRHKKKGISAVALSPDGTRLATASMEKFAAVWACTTGQLLFQVQAPGFLNWVGTVAFSPRGTQMVTVSGNFIDVWDSTTGRKLTKIRQQLAVAASFSPDGTRLATGGGDKTVRVWNVSASQELTRSTHDDMVSAVAFSPDGTRLATGSFDTTVRVWDSATGKELTRLYHDSKVLAVAFNPDGTRLTTVSLMTARVWDVGASQELTRFNHDQQVGAVALSPDGSHLATSSRNTARVIDTTAGQQLTSFTHDEPVLAVAFSHDSTRLATGCADKAARIWLLSDE
jgi:WD40 repeat protein